MLAAKTPLIYPCGVVVQESVYRGANPRAECAKRFEGKGEGVNGMVVGKFRSLYRWVLIPGLNARS